MAQFRSFVSSSFQFRFVVYFLINLRLMKHSPYFNVYNLLAVVYPSTGTDILLPILRGIQGL